MEFIYTLNDLPGTASQLLASQKPWKVMAIHGEMGAGKTTLIHELCSQMGVIGNVSSPTFALVNEYRTRDEKTIYHMDWYRLIDEADALHAGMEEYLYSGNTCLVEWPERAPHLLPPDTVHVFLEILGRETRRASLTIAVKP
jgi:tRNA threonylcarbamoyladenosine biosynthesis protein TsaE